jgi:tetratricopeptide (TPR) repeat protein
VSEGVDEARPEAEGELAMARLALDGSELSHAAAHLGNAIASDPTLPEVYSVLDDLAARADDALDLYPMAGQLYIGAVAARSYLLARAGMTAEAFGLLCDVAATEPGKAWAAGWLAPDGQPDAAVIDRLDPDAAVPPLIRLARVLPDPLEPDLALVLSPFLETARRIVDRHPERIEHLALLSGLARRFGAYQDAIAWCERAEEAGDGAMAVIMLGYALRSSGEHRGAHSTWVRALKLDPGNVYLRVDIAEHLTGQGRIKEGLAWLEDGLTLEPDHPKAFPSACETRFQLDGDFAHLIRLADWWREHPEHDYAGQMLAKACDQSLWLAVVPWPNEAVANMLRQVAEDKDPAELRATTARLTLSALEVPSAMTALRTTLPEFSFVAEPPVQDPDIRVPLAEGRYRLWTYVGVEALPVAPVPTVVATATIRSVAENGYPPHPVAAYDAAVELSALSLDDLLGVMVHATPAPGAAWWQRIDRADPMYWPRTAQAWACLGLLHHRADEPWLSSTRREVLVDLLNGPEDWVTDAAMNALVVAAWANPEVRDDVRELVTQRFLHSVTAYGQRPVTIIRPMAQLVLATPGMDRNVVELARNVIREEEQQEQGETA